MMTAPLDGQIAACDTAGCGRCCCDFSAGNYIVLYPGELNAAVDRGETVAHLAVRPSSDGGHRAICHAGDKGTCDGGYKPLDCASYPLFPSIDARGDVTVDLTGQKCPLRLRLLDAHSAWVRQAWVRLAQRSQAVADWIASVHLIGYARRPPGETRSAASESVTADPGCVCPTPTPSDVEPTCS